MGSQMSTSAMQVISNEITNETKLWTMQEVGTMSQNAIPFNVNFDSLLGKYRVCAGNYYGRAPNFKLFCKYDFSISLVDGTRFPAYIAIFHEKDSNLSGFIFDIEKELKEMININLSLDFQLTINETHSEIGDKIQGKYIIYHFNNCQPTEHLNSVKGRMTFTFEIKSLLTFHKEFIHHLGLNMVRPGGKEDFTIICEDQKIKFEKQLLINVSTVFREMLENQWTKESKDGQVEIKEVKPETILAFKRLLLNSNDFKKEDFNIEMMIFADRYDIKALLDLCGKYIDSFDVNDENVFEFVQGIYLINNGSFMNKAITLMKNNYGALEQDPRWKEFAKEHSDCVFKMLKLFAEK